MLPSQLAARPRWRCSRSLQTVSVAQPIEPWQVATYESVTSAQISPDGSHIAYVVSVPRKPLEDESGAPWAELHVLEVGEQEPRPLRHR